jgi:hypothetical protein
MLCSINSAQCGGDFMVNKTDMSEDNISCEMPDTSAAAVLGDMLASAGCGREESGSLVRWGLLLLWRCNMTNVSHKLTMHLIMSSEQMWNECLTIILCSNPTHSKNILFRLVLCHT